MDKLLLIVFAVVFLLGCSKNNNPSPKTPVTIFDKWLITGDTSRQYFNGLLNSSYITVGINSPYYQFNTDGSGILKNNISDPDQILNFTYTVTDNTINFDFPVQAAQPTYSYQASATIQKLTGHTMIILFDDFSPGNASYEYKEDIYLSR
jgi:hypothetical protein